MALHGCKRVSVAGCFSLKAALLLVAAVPGFAQSVIPVPGANAPSRVTQRVASRRPIPQDSTQSATLRWTREMLADAELTDVFFIDPEYGWAVGDRGVIRVTRDGGQSWRLIRAPGNCRLESVRFLDRKNGWAVGGWTQPYTHKTTGLVLRSHDGGLSWEAISDVTLPALKEIRMLDGTRGWAVGTPSALYPSGIFQTTNGGRSWTAIPGKSSHTWTTCEFRSTRGGIAAGESGESTIALSTGLRKSRADNFAPRKIHDICMLDAQLGWMVGDGGLALTTVDGGLSWIVPPKPVPKVVREQFDFRAVAACGPQCWIAGTPGSRIWHTPDGGQTWSSAKTGINTPITSLTFIDTKRGWAVGSFGTILATTDGGRSWRRQQTGGTRAAVLGVFADTHNVPLELFARLSGNEGYLGQSLILFRRDMPNSESFTPLTESPESGRIHGAMTSVGACGAETAWRYPISKEGLGFSEKQMAHLVNLAADGRGLDLLQRQVVRSIRQWRPEILVVDSPDFARDKGAAAVARRLTLNAVKMAADPTVMTDQMTTGGLEPWRVKRVYSLCTSKQAGAIPLASTQAAPYLGRAIGEQAALARSLVSVVPRPLPPTLWFEEITSSAVVTASTRRGFFRGGSLVAGGDARRQLAAVPQVNPIDLHRRAQQRQNIEQMVKRLEHDTQRGASLLGGIGRLTRDMSPEAIGDLYMQLARRYRQQGEPDLAADLLKSYAQQYPLQPMTDRVLVDLLHYYSSGEMTIGTQSERDVNAEAIEAAAIIQRVRPALYVEPQVLFPAAAAMRKKGEHEKAAQLMRRALSLGTDQCWKDRALGEQWLCNPRAQGNRPIWSCRQVTNKPHLDGKFEDDFWKKVEPVYLKGKDNESSPATGFVKTAWDKKFFYFAIECRKASTFKYQKTDAPRPRDADLCEEDRVELLLDIDRDYASWFRLVVDHRGWTAESRMGDPTWNPDWFVAADSNDELWRVEGAIPLHQLTATPLDNHTVWAVGAQRVTPGVGFSSWTHPSAPQVRPEGFGYMIFGGSLVAFRRESGPGTGR